MAVCQLFKPILGTLQNTIFLDTNCSVVATGGREPTSMCTKDTESVKNGRDQVGINF